MTRISDWDAERRARLVWGHLAEPGDGDAGALVAAVGAVEALRMLDRRRPAELDAQRWAAAVARWTPRRRGVDLDDQARRADAVGARFLVPGDEDWPCMADDLGAHAPLGLWVRGDATTLATDPMVAIVGARASTGYGEHVAAELAADLGGGGAGVVSGAAYGIDGTAHRAVLASGGRTVAVLAGGVDRVYPAGHAALIAEVARSGAVVSEVPLASVPTKWRFLARNRLIAAFAHATVVVEAGWRSGSLNTAAHAASLGRPLGAVPGPVTSAASAGCHRLLREFDATCVTCADDVREMLGFTDPALVADGAECEAANERRVLDALTRRTPRTSDDVAARSGLSVADAEATLGLLGLAGRVHRDADGWRAR